jgi:hypothetical protein
VSAPRDLEQLHPDPADEFWRLDDYIIVNEDALNSKIMLKAEKS